MSAHSALIALLLLASAAGAWAQSDQERELAESALSALEAGDLAESARLLGVASITPEEASDWAAAVGERVEAIRAIVRTRDACPPHEESAEVWMRLGAVRALRVDSAPPTLREITPEQVGSMQSRVADAEAAAAGAQRALEALQEQLASAPGEIESLTALERKLREGLLTSEEAGPLERYRLQSIDLRTQAAIERRQYLVAGLTSWPVLLELRSAERDLAAKQLLNDAECLGRMEFALSAQLETKLEQARDELERIELSGSEAGEDVLTSLRRNVEVLEAHLGAVHADDQSKTLTEWKTKVEAANERLADRLARLKERITDVAGISTRTPELLTANIDFVHENQDLMEHTLQPELKKKLRKNILARAEVQDRLLELTRTPEGAIETLTTDDVAKYLRTHQERLNAIVQTLLDIDGLYVVRRETLDDMESFLLSNLYWVQSGDPLGPETLNKALLEFEQVADSWAGEASRAWIQLQAGSELWRFVLLVLGFVGLIGGGVWLHRRMSVGTTRWNYVGGPGLVIIQRLLATALLSTLAPLLLVSAALLLELLVLPSAIQVPLRTLLISLGAALFLRRFFGSMFREEGVAVVELGVPPAVAAQLRRASRMATTGMVLVVLPWYLLRTIPVQPSLEQLPRLVFMLVAAWYAVVLVFMLRRQGPLVQAVTGGAGFWSRVAGVLPPLVVVATVFVLAMDGLGYRYGARLLTVSIAQTFLAGLVLAGVYNLLTTLLEQTARKYRQDLRTEVGAAEARELAEKHARQVSRFVGVATVVATVTLLVRFWEFGGGIRSVFEAWEIVLVDQDADVWLTSWDVVVSLAWIIGGHFVVASLPGILHFVVFSRLPNLQIGTRFVIVSVLRYSLLLVAYAGAVLSLHMSFSSLGWALAAVSLGVGFGLQEIISNFVSGLILFLERPVRVGDVVTVGTTTGTVERINIRATEITNFDRQVIIIPNRKFISEDVTNWTHNDVVVRSMIEVGVAYGTDMVKVRKVLFEVVSAVPVVRKHPEPKIWFWSFGESTLNVRVFIHTVLENRVQGINDVNLEIARRFTEEGIEIAFPQHDLHIRSVNDAVPLMAVPADGSGPLLPPEDQPA